MIVAAARHGRAELGEQFTIGIVVSRDDELRHRIVAALPLGGALREIEGKEDMQPVAFGGAGW